MTCIVYGMAHMNKAFDTIIATSDDNFDENSKKASNFLRIAAGIFEFVSTREIPHWVDIPNDRPMELNAQMLTALADYCSATAQTIAIKKALLAGQMSRQVMAKLAVDVWKKYEFVEKTFKEHEDWKEISAPWKSFLGLQWDCPKQLPSSTWVRQLTKMTNKVQQLLT